MKDCEEGEKGEMCGGGREGREEERRGDGGRGPCTTRSRHYDFLRAPGRDMSSSIALPSGAARAVTTAVKRGHLQRPTSLAAHKAVIGERSTSIIMLNRHCKPRPWLWRSPGGGGAQVAETLEAWPTHMSAIALHVLTATVHVMLGNVCLGNSNSRARPSTASRQTPMGA